MSDLRELYQQVVLDHSRKPRNFHQLENATHQAEGFNPLCGDRVTVYCVLGEDTIEAISFIGSGCALCTASASMMSQLLTGKGVRQTHDCFLKFRELVAGKADPTEVSDDLDKLTVFAGVREFPIRVKCVTLPWHTMTSAINNQRETTSTE